MNERRSKRDTDANHANVFTGERASDASDAKESLSIRGVHIQVGAIDIVVHALYI